MGHDRGFGNRDLRMMLGSNTGRFARVDGTGTRLLRLPGVDLISNESRRTMDIRGYRPWRVGREGGRGRSRVTMVGLVNYGLVGLSVEALL